MPARIKKNAKTIEAIGLTLIGMASFAAMNTVAPLLAPFMAPGELVLFRNLFSLLIIIVWSIALQGGIPRFKTQRLQSHFWRASIGVVAMELWFYSLTLMPLTLATALSFTVPIFSTIFAMLMLGEDAGKHRLLAITVSFFGIWVILRPDTNGMNMNSLVVLLSTLIMALAAVLVKSLSRTESPETIVFYMALFMIPWSIPPAFLHWQMPTIHGLWLVFLIALFSTVAHLMMARAYKRVDLVVLMPFDFMRLVFTALFAYLMFDEVMTLHTFEGALIIVASSAYIARREVKNRDVRGAAKGMETEA